MEEETFALRDVLRTLRRHRAQILAVMAVAALAGLVLSFAQPKRYTATSELLLGSAVPDAALPDSRTTSKAGPLGLDLPAESQARVLASPLIAARVSSRLRLSPDQAAAEELAKDVQVKAVTDNVLLITTDAPTALEAAALANGFAAEYLSYRQETAKNALATMAMDYQRRARSTRREADALASQITEATNRGASGEVARLNGERSDLLDQVRTLSRGYQLLIATQAADLGVGEVIAPARPPERSSSPLPIRNLLVGAVLGTVIGISVALLREHTNDRVQTRDDAARVTGRSVIAAIPRRRGPWIAIAEQIGGPKRRATLVKNELITLRAPDSAGAEAYRELRSNLVGRGFGVQFRRLLVTSVAAGPETSKTVANLAVVCARSGLLTMAISADLRHSQLHSYFGVSDGIGLAASLDSNGAPTDDNALPMALVAGAVANLLVLPSGRVTSSPGDLLASAPLSDIFGVAAEIAQVLIIEAPPILSSGEVLTLAAHADAVLLVVRSGADKEALAARAAATLELAGRPILGTILQDARRDDDTVGVAEEPWSDRSRRPARAEPIGDWAPPRPDLTAPSAPGQRGGSARLGAEEQRRPDDN